MAPLLHRKLFKVIRLLNVFVSTAFQLPCWLIYYSWQPNRPRKSWTLYRTIRVRILRKLTQVLNLGVTDGRSLSLEVPQEELESLNARFVWIPELEKEDIVGVVAEHAARTGVKSITIPAYWILKEGDRWSPSYDEALRDEKVVLYLHGGGFVVRLFPPLHLASVLTLVPGGDCLSISSNSIPCQRNTQILDISLQSVVSRLPTQFRASFCRMAEPIPSCHHGCDCSVQVPCLRGWIPTSEHHRGG